MFEDWVEFWVWLLLFVSGNFFDLPLPFSQTMIVSHSSVVATCFPNSRN